LQAWYVEQGAPVTGQRLVAEIFKRIERLPDNPDMGRIVPEFKQPFLRELIHPTFRIVYRREAQRIRIVRVWRSERLLKLPQERLSR
jgi:toxin ParE1/3/4